MKKLSEIDIQYVKGVGPKRAEIFKKHGFQSVNDLLFYFPYRHLDRRNVLQIKDLVLNEECTVIAEVFSKKIQFGRRKKLNITLVDDTGFLTVIFFNNVHTFDKIFKVGDHVALSGKVNYYNGFQMVHPDFEFLRSNQVNPDKTIHTAGIVPLYSIPEAMRKKGITSNSLRKMIFNAIQQFGIFISETLSDSVLNQTKLPKLNYVIQKIHFPDSPESLQAALNRLKFEEVFYFLMLMELQKKQYSMPKTGIAFKQIDDIVKKVIQDLPFELTAAQRRVLREIYTDMQQDKPMHRLLQGDVGSGKTIVALIAMLIARANGYQSALMVPTEILADQHYYNFKNLLFPFGIEPVLLKGSQTAKQKTVLKQKISEDPQAIIIGTHALIQENVDFERLGLVVIDEQHRFGVMQRAKLVEKGKIPDILVMTATPIPRTLGFLLYGDLEQSKIDELPAGRKEVKTAWRKWNHLPKIIDYIYKEGKEGKQAYFVLPLIEESEKMDLKAAMEMYDDLKQTKLHELGIGLLHGKMKAADKENVMTRFKSGEIKVLVSTTVIEVGVDVPQATMMVIVHAERFGLAQLHQLRGRVGRGKEQSYCVLLTPEKISDIAEKRMQIMCNTTDGFQIAEDDLKLRGVGELTGTRQHGAAEFLYFDPVEDSRLIGEAKSIVLSIINKDPHLRGSEYSIIRSVLTEKFKDKLTFLKAY